MGSSIDSCTIEKIWKLLRENQSLFLMLDPDDFLKLTNSAKKGWISTTNGAY